MTEIEIGFDDLELAIDGSPVSLFAYGTAHVVSEHDTLEDWYVARITMDQGPTINCTDKEGFTGALFAAIEAAVVKSYSDEIEEALREAGVDCRSYADEHSLIRTQMGL